MGSLFKVPKFGRGVEQFFRNVVSQIMAERKINNNVCKNERVNREVYIHLNKIYHTTITWINKPI